jgi:ATP-dependent DNA helicase RecG
LYHFPIRYDHISQIRSVSTLTKGEQVVIYGTISKIAARKTWKSRRAIAEAWLTDGTHKIRLRWFNQPYIAKMVADGATVKVSGIVTGNERSLYIANPEIEHSPDLPIDRHDSLFTPEADTEGSVFAIYPETKGITSRWLRHALERALRNNIHEQMADPIPENIRTRLQLPTLATALVWIHGPKNDAHAKAARKRFAFEEMLAIQTARIRDREALRTERSIPVSIDRRRAQEFIASLGFPLTDAQHRAIAEITADLSAPHPMARLLEGDVGSGKTVVAAASLCAVVSTPPPEREFGHLQGAYMAPTEILAAQQFASLSRLFGTFGIPVGLITGSGCYKYPSKLNPNASTPVSRAQLLKWIASGEVPLVIGTHALAQEKVRFRNLALVVIDEQHRFGTRIRRALTRKDGALPHLLSMTATPIPRTLALTIWGDLDLTIIDEMPKGRLPVITEVVTPIHRKSMYAAVIRELNAGRQAYVICPRIEEPDPDQALALSAKSVTAEAARLATQELTGFRIAVLHGKLTPKEKESVMNRFVRHEIDVLVATSVVEVGVSVANATVIVIEGAERYGLAQLHQLRGRVIRGTQQPYCFVVPETYGPTTKKRLEALTTAKNGFELSEFDLAIRGPGELAGRAQSGLSDLGMEALKNPKLVAEARASARSIIETDASLRHVPALLARVNAIAARMHDE